MRRCGSAGSEASAGAREEAEVREEEQAGGSGASVAWRDEGKGMARQEQSEVAERVEVAGQGK